MLSMVLSLACLTLLEDLMPLAVDNAPAAQAAKEATEVGVRCDVVVEKTGAVLRTLETRLDPEGHFYLQAAYSPTWCRIEGTVQKLTDSRSKLSFKYMSGECITVHKGELFTAQGEMKTNITADRVPVHCFQRDQFIERELELIERDPVAIGIAKSAELLVFRKTAIALPSSSQQCSEGERSLMQVRTLRLTKDSKPGERVTEDTSRLIETLVGKDGRWNARVRWNEEEQFTYGQRQDSTSDGTAFEMKYEIVGCCGSGGGGRLKLGNESTRGFFSNKSSDRANLRITLWRTRKFRSDSYLQ